MSLFGNAPSQTRSRNLVEFKAGKMNLRGKMVYPDKRKGLVYLYQGNDMLMHLCWKERTSSTPEDDLVIFPDETEFKKVTQNTTGRVYILKWNSNARKLFFWMQEPKEDKDEEFCRKLNDLLNHPPSPGFGDSSSSSGGAHPLQSVMERMAGGGAGGLDHDGLSNVLRGMNPTELASLLSSFGGRRSGASSLMQSLHRTAGGGSTSASTQQSGTSSRQDTSTQQTADSRPNTAPASTRSVGTTATTTNRNDAPGTSTTTTPANTANSTASSKPKSSAIQMSALTNVLANLGNNTTEGATASSSKPVIDLNDLITSENLIPLLSNKDVQEKIRSHLPENNLTLTTEKELKDSIQSPQFREIVNAFSTTLQSGQLESVLTQFNFPEDVTQAVNQKDVQAFAQALEKYYSTSNEKGKSSDNTMDTD